MALRGGRLEPDFALDSRHCRAILRCLFSQRLLRDASIRSKIPAHPRPSPGSDARLLPRWQIGVRLPVIVQMYQEAARSLFLSDSTSRSDSGSTSWPRTRRRDSCFGGAERRHVEVRRKSPQIVTGERVIVRTCTSAPKKNAHIMKSPHGRRTNRF